MNKPAAFLGALALFTALLSEGCERRKYYISDCETSHPGPECPKKETCPGQCLPIPPVQWKDPILLWSGPEMMAPACPADRAAQMVYEGHADPVDPPECAACACEPPAGECELPSVLTASTGLCNEFGLPYDFSGLDPTDCNTDHGVPAMLGPMSVAIAPLRITERGCQPVDPLPPLENGPTSWQTYARGCRGIAFAPCSDPARLCVPTAEPPPEGFAQCIFREGDHECPEEYPDKRVFYDGANDTRSCSACACGEPIGSVCSATVTVYGDTGCTVGPLVYFMNSNERQCQSLISPAALGKKVDDITYEPGSCPSSGGEPVGSADLIGASTFCCQL
jgi:hypothetical protein